MAVEKLVSGIKTAELLKLVPASKPTKTVGRDSEGKVLPHKRDESTAEFIADLVACGADETDIAVQLNIRPGLLRQHYKRELDGGAFLRNMAVAHAILTRAIAGDMMAAMYWTRARMGWSVDSEKAAAARGGLGASGYADAKQLLAAKIETLAKRQGENQ